MTNRPLLAAVILFIGWQAQLALAGARPLDGIVLYAAAMILFVAFFHSRTALRPLAQPPATPASGRHGEWRALRAALGAALLLALGALALFGLGGHDDWGWTLYLLSMLVLLAAAVRVSRRGTLRAESLHVTLRRGAGEWLVLLLILAVALVVRVWDNGDIPP